MGQYAFVIEDVEAIKAKFIEDNYRFYGKLAKLPIKKRYSVWKDEYQVRDFIPLDKVVGVKIPSKNNIFSDYCPSYIDDGKGIDFFLKQMESVNGNFPFIDIDDKKIIEKEHIKEYIYKR